MIQKSSLIFYLILVAIISNAQIITVGNSANAITITPEGINSKPAHPSDTTNAALGNMALKDSRSGNNVAVGFGSLRDNWSGTNNTAIGSNTLMRNVQNSGLTAIGAFAMEFQSGSRNQTELYNTAVGYGALRGYEDVDYVGSFNLALGAMALMANRSGDNNTASGYKALRSNYSGHNNTALGSESLLSNYSGNHNLALGAAALRENRTGHLNVAVGYKSLETSQSGSYNISLGAESLVSNLAGHYNIAVGYQALMSNKNNSRSTAIGYQALRYADDRTENIKNTYNTAVGYAALRGNLPASNNTGIYNTALGDQALLNNSAGNDNVAVGYGSVDNNTTGSYNTAVGTLSLTNNQIGNNNTALGRSALHKSTGHDNLALGYNAALELVNGRNNIAIGYEAQVNNNMSNQVRIGNAEISRASIQVAWTVTSDERWKDNIQELPIGLEFVSKLRPVSYTRRNDSSGVEMGIIAQELKETLNSFGLNDLGLLSADDNGYYSVRYNDLIAPLIKSIQELKSLVELQQNHIVNQENLLRELKNQMHAIRVTTD